MKLLFVINNMKIGGTRRSLINFLNYLNNYDVEVSLLIFSPYGEYINEIPKNINVLEGDAWLKSSFSEIEDLKKSKSYISILNRVILKIGKKLLGEKKVIKFIFNNYIKKIENYEYDAVIGFQEGLCNDFASMVNSKKNILWIHNNYENLQPLSRGFKESYENASNIVFVANASMDTFVNNMPELVYKMSVIKNTLPQKNIISLGDEDIEDEKIFKTNAINIVSVGRVAPQKAFDRIVEVGKYLKKKDLNFNWIIIGDGENKSKLKNKIEIEGLGQYIKLIGSKPNPYAYIKKSDLFVMTSIYESQPMAIMEALTLGVPVITTKFDSVNEIIKDKPFAIVCENSVDGLCMSIEEIINNKEKINSMKISTCEFKYNNEKIVKQFFSLII